MNRRGMTLIEMLVAVAIFLVVMAAVLAGLRGQSQSFDRGSENMAMLQNMRFAADLLNQEMQTAGTSLAPGQPPLVYAGDDSFSFNTDYVSITPGDLSAVYVDTDAPAAEAVALSQANQIIVPQSAPAFSYPPVDYPGGNAETITIFFQPDTTTADPGDFILLRQVNDQPSEVLIRNVLPYVGRPFFRYFQVTASDVDTVPSSWVPMSHSQTYYTGSETGVAGRINRIRAVEVNYQISNGLSGPDQRTRQMSFTVPLTAVGQETDPGCGAVPTFAGPVSATATDAPPSGARPGRRQIRLTWPAAADEFSGERDIVRYLVTRVAGSDTVVRTIPSGRTSYFFTDDSITAGTSYSYLVAAQDCTPATSTPVASPSITP